MAMGTVDYLKKLKDLEGDKLRLNIIDHDTLEQGFIYLVYMEDLIVVIGQLAWTKLSLWGS